MSTTPNYNWPLIEPTDFVTNLPADLETLADAIDATVDGIETIANAAIPETLIDAAGDLIYGSAADTAARLAIGTAGQVLKVNGTADAPEWSAVVVPATNWTLLNSGGTSLTTDTVTISGISGKDKIMVLVADASTGNNSSVIRFRINGNSGAVYTTHGAQFTATSAYAAGNVTGTYTPDINEINLANYGADPSGRVQAAITLTGCNSSGVKQHFFTGGGSTGGSSNNTLRVGQGVINDTNTVSSITIFVTAGTFDLGSVFVYASE
jgi:hypothetical protein